MNPHTVSTSSASCRHLPTPYWPLGHVLSAPGLNTVSLVTGGYIQEITPDELLPGDLVGHCGLGTSGDAGHIVVFDRWDRAQVTYWAYEFHGGPQLGPEHSLQERGPR